LTVAAVVGVPLITPAVDGVRPAGSAPDVMDHIYGGVPPVAAKLWEYAVPTVPFGRGDAVVIASGGGSTVSANDFVVICDALSRTRTVKFAVPAVVGVPVITPAADNVRPAGGVPDVTDHKYGGAPPLAAKLWEYAAPTMPFGRGDDVVIEIGGMIVRENPFVTGFETLSATRITKLLIPTPVGVPPMTPAADNVRPPGNVPDATDHVYGGIPPLATNPWEYGMPIAPLGRGEEVSIKSGGVIVIESTLDAVCTPLSATCTVKVVVPIAAFFGLPLIFPPPDRLSPSGRDPESTVQL
jgi:hypothetical protein